MAVFEISRALLVIPGTGPLLLMLPQGGGREMTYHDNLIRSQTERIKVVFLVLMTMAALSGCATGKMNEQTQSWVRSHRDDKITQIPHQVFDLKSIVPSGQQPQVEVRLAKPGEISKVWPAGFFEGFSTGSALAAAGIGATMLDAHGSRCRSRWRHTFASTYYYGNHEQPLWVCIGQVYAGGGLSEECGKTCYSPT